MRSASLILGILGTLAAPGPAGAQTDDWARIRLDGRIVGFARRTEDRRRGADPRSSTNHYRVEIRLRSSQGEVTYSMQTIAVLEEGQLQEFERNVTMEPTKPAKEGPGDWPWRVLGGQGRTVLKRQADGKLGGRIRLGERSFVTFPDWPQAGPICFTFLDLFSRRPRYPNRDAVERPLLVFPTADLNRSYPELRFAYAGDDSPRGALLRDEGLLFEAWSSRLFPAEGPCMYPLSLHATVGRAFEGAGYAEIISDYVRGAEWRLDWGPATWRDGTYRNPALGLSVNAPKEWRFSPESGEKLGRFQRSGDVVNLFITCLKPQCGEERMIDPAAAGIGPWTSGPAPVEDLEVEWDGVVAARGNQWFIFVLGGPLPLRIRYYGVHPKEDPRVLELLRSIEITPSRAIGRPEGH